jgi:hypothetical protein
VLEAAPPVSRVVDFHDLGASGQFAVAVASRAAAVAALAALHVSVFPDAVPMVAHTAALAEFGPLAAPVPVVLAALLAPVAPAVAHFVPPYPDAALVPVVPLRAPVAPAVAHFVPPYPDAVPAHSLPSVLRSWPAIPRVPAAVSLPPRGLPSPSGAAARSAAAFQACVPVPSGAAEQAPEAAAVSLSPRLAG